MNTSRLLFPEFPSSSAALPVAADAPPLSALARPFVGEFAWRQSESGALFDFEHLELRADGTYVARVDARLLNARVRSFGAPCTLREEGGWNAYQVSGGTRIRIRPTTGRARVYCVTSSGDKLTLCRRGGTATLFVVEACPHSVRQAS
jgi:hypothetical protein